MYSRDIRRRLGYWLLATLALAAPLARAQETHDVPRQVGLDEAVAKMDSTDAAGRESFWHSFGLLLNGIESPEDGGGLRLEFGAARRLRFGLTLRDPELSEEAKTLLDNDAEEQALRDLTPTDDVTVDVKCGFGVPDARELPRLVATAIQPFVQAELERRLHDTERALPPGTSADAVVAWAMAQQAAAPGDTATKTDYWALQLAIQLVTRSTGDDAIAVASAALQPPVECVVLESAFADFSPKPPFLVRVLPFGPPQAECQAVARGALEHLAKIGGGLPADRTREGALKSLAEDLAAVAPAYDDVLEAESTRAAEWTRRSAADSGTLAEETPMQARLNGALRSVYLAHRNRPQGSVSISYRDRDELLGTDSTTIAGSVTFGFPRLPRRPSVDVIKDWLRESAKERSARDWSSARRLDAHAHSFAAQASWTRSDELKSRQLPALYKDGYSTLTASFNWSTKVAPKQFEIQGVPAGADSSLTLSYEDPADRSANNRFIAKYVLTFHISDKLQFPLTIMYANREEFVEGDDVRGHFGLSYVLGSDKPAVKAAQ